MSAPFDPFCGLKKRPEMLEASFSYSPPLSSSPLLAAATIVKGILEAADAEKEHRLLSEQGIGHRGDAGMSRKRGGVSPSSPGTTPAEKKFVDGFGAETQRKMTTTKN